MCGIDSSVCVCVCVCVSIYRPAAHVLMTRVLRSPKGAKDARRGKLSGFLNYIKNPISRENLAL